MTLMEGIVEDTLVFCDNLDKYAKSGTTFSLDDAATRLTIDIIGRVAL